MSITPTLTMSPEPHVSRTIGAATDGQKTLLAPCTTFSPAAPCVTMDTCRPLSAFAGNVSPRRSTEYFNIVVDPRARSNCPTSSMSDGSKKERVRLRTKRTPSPRRSRSKDSPCKTRDMLATRRRRRKPVPVRSVDIRGSSPSVSGHTKEKLCCPRASCFWVYAYPAFLRPMLRRIRRAGTGRGILPQASEISPRRFALPPFAAEFLGTWRRPARWG